MSDKPQPYQDLFLSTVKKYLTHSMEQSPSWEVKLTFTQLVNKFPAFNLTWRFITVFRRAFHWSLSWSSWIQSTTSHPLSLRYILISCHLCLGLLSTFFPSGFPTKILYAFLISPMYTTCCVLLYIIIVFYWWHVTPRDTAGCKGIAYSYSKIHGRFSEHYLNFTSHFQKINGLLHNIISKFESTYLVLLKLMWDFHPLKKQYNLVSSVCK